MFWILEFTVRTVPLTLVLFTENETYVDGTIFLCKSNKAFQNEVVVIFCKHLEAVIFLNDFNWLKIHANCYST